jgi:hypothetical protein
MAIWEHAPLPSHSPRGGGGGESEDEEADMKLHPDAELFCR